jgi:hypothetical protein
MDLAVLFLLWWTGAFWPLLQFILIAAAIVGAVWLAGATVFGLGGLVGELAKLRGATVWAVILLVGVAGWVILDNFFR